MNAPALRITPTTSCNRNGTYIRVLIVVDTAQPMRVLRLDAIDIRVQRLIVLAASTVETLDEHTTSLRSIAVAESIELISADGHHDELIQRIADANGQSR